MRYRHAYIEKDKVLADSGTEVIDIRVKDPITEFIIQVYATNYGARNIQSPIARCVSKIELVDGSDVLFSLNGHQTIALAFYDAGIMPARKIAEFPGYSQVDHFPIRFGRFSGDPVLAFDPTKFTNPQLKITWDLATVNTIDSDGFIADSGRLTVIAKIMEEPAAAPTGFLMNKEHYSFTTAGSGDETIDLPTDYPYRKLLVRPYKTLTEITSVITDLKLSIDQGKFVPFDLASMDLSRMMEDWFGVARGKIAFSCDSGDTRELWMDMEINAWAIADEAQFWMFAVQNAWAGHCTIHSYFHDGNTVDGVYGLLCYNARCVESSFCYPFGRQDLIEEAFQAPDFGSVRLVLTQDTADAAASVVLQQIRNY